MVNERTNLSLPESPRPACTPPIAHTFPSTFVTVSYGKIRQREGDRAKTDKGGGRSCTSFAPAPSPLTVKNPSPPEAALVLM